MAKYALLGGGELLERVERLAARPLRAARVGQALVAEVVEYKVSVVAADEREDTGARAVLNLGHTVGHAIEAATAFPRYSHGEAVGLGLHATCGSRGARRAEPGRAGARELLDGLGLPRRLTGTSAEEVCDLTPATRRPAPTA